MIINTTVLYQGLVMNPLLSVFQAGLPVWGTGVWDEPPPPRLLSRARWVQPAARAAAFQLCWLQRQIPAPLPLQGLSQRPGGAVQGLPMTRGGPVDGNSPLRPHLQWALFSFLTYKQWLCSLTSDQRLAAKVGKTELPLRELQDYTLGLAGLRGSASSIRTAIFTEWWWWNASHDCSVKLSRKCNEQSQGKLCGTNKNKQHFFNAWSSQVCWLGVAWIRPVS